MREDILSPAQQAVQGIHAAIEAARQGLIPPEIEHPHLVYCTVTDGDHLQAVAALLDQAGVASRSFSEADLGDQITALCTEPVDRAALPSRVRKRLRNLKLVGDARQDALRAV